ncbi:MAG: hypothetical protein NT027_14430 [Proteobacteria bacterium]|nr:hypothetical protein [Pseudomonadota bacterium]
MKINLALVGMLSFTVLIQACKTSDFTGSAKREAELPPQEVKSFKQLLRESRTVSAKQGKKGATSNESYAVTAKGVLDLLIVVDNSGSMAQEQSNLADRMTPLLSAVKDSDWQIAITTTDPKNNCVTSLIQKGDWFVETRFKNAINAGTDGTGIERHFLRAVEGLQSTCLFGPGKWVRKNSTLAVLFLTDEDNCFVGSGGQGYACSGAPDLSPNYLIDYLSSIRKIGTEARVYGLYWGPNSQCSTALKSADEISKVVAATSGTWGSICDNDYSTTLSKISSDVAKILKADFSLKSIPDAGTLKVNVNGQLWPHYNLNGKVVNFTQTPPQGAAITVSYVSGAAGIVESKFALPSTPVPGSISAKINGQAAAGQINWDDSSKSAVFATLPVEGSDIEITYKENTPLLTVFEIAPNAMTEHVQVTVNGVALKTSEFEYNSVKGSVTLKVAPAEGARIDIAWRGEKKQS